MVLVALGRSPVLLCLLGPQAAQAHQTSYPILAAVHTLLLEFAVNARTTVGPVALIVHDLDL